MTMCAQLKTKIKISEIDVALTANNFIDYQTGTISTHLLIDGVALFDAILAKLNPEALGDTVTLRLDLKEPTRVKRWQTQFKEWTK